MSDILIAGLPGCGKSRWIAAQPDAERFREWRWGEPIPAGVPVWTLVDMRGDPEAVFPDLKPFWGVSAAFLGIFAEETELFRQAAWRKKFDPQNFGGTPLHFSHYLVRPEGLPVSTSRTKTVGLPLPVLRKLTVRLPVVVLEHLLFVLQGLEQSTPMRFWRVRGRLDTLEYAHAVAVEGSLAGLFTHAEDAADGLLHLWVENVQMDLLTEGLQAALAPGFSMDIASNSE